MSAIIVEGVGQVATTCRVQVTGEADLAELSAQIPIGSVAHTANMSRIWIKDNDGSWAEFGAADSAGGE